MHGDCDIYELDSRFERPLQQFRALSEFEAHFAITDWRVGSSDTILLQLHVHGAGGRFVARVESASTPSRAAVQRFVIALRVGALFSFI